jgi:TRAP-type C4-dicarboxylate transport system permease large subunit
MVMFLVAAAALLAWTLTREGVPQILASTMAGLSTSPWVFLLISNVVFVVLGAVLEGVAILIILIPLLMPLVRSLGIDPLHYGILVIMAIGIGVFLPPIGVCMYVACGIARITMGQATRAFIPYLAVLFLGLLVITYVPWFTLVLPNALFQPK